MQTNIANQANKKRQEERAASKGEKVVPIVVRSSKFIYADKKES